MKAVIPPEGNAGSPSGQSALGGWRRLDRVAAQGLRTSNGQLVDPGAGGSGASSGNFIQEDIHKGPCY